MYKKGSVEWIITMGVFGSSADRAAIGRVGAVVLCLGFGGASCILTATIWWTLNYAAVVGGRGREGSCSCITFSAIVLSTVALASLFLFEPS